MDFFKQIGDLAGRYLPWFQEYGNALFSPITGGLEQQPLGGSGLYGNNPDGSTRSMGDALNYIGKTAKERNAVLEQLRR
jgi:hypothetical protein